MMGRTGPFQWGDVVQVTGPKQRMNTIVLTQGKQLHTQHGSVPHDDFVGAVMNDLASRRGRVRGTEPAGDPGRTTITAHVPAFELVRYTQVLRSLGHGSGTFTRSPDHYAPAPAAVQERLTEVAS